MGAFWRSQVLARGVGAAAASLLLCTGVAWGTPFGASFSLVETGRVLKRPRAPRIDPPTPPASHEEALARQLNAKWGSQVDRDHQAKFPLADSKHWERVHYSAFEHLTAFRYGEERDVLVTAFTVRTPGTPTSEACLREFEQAALPRLEPFSVRWSDARTVAQNWQRKPIAVHQADGQIQILFTRYRFSAAWTAYPAYRDGCLVYSTVVLWDGGQEIAKRVRDRWVEEGFKRFAPRTTELPERKPRTR